MKKIIEDKFLGSKIALVLGFLLFISGFTPNATALVTGLIIVIGTLAYKSAKMRKLKLVKGTSLRIVSEILAMFLVALLILMQNNLKTLMIEDPFPNVIIPAWVLISYVVVNSREFKDDKGKE